jgi:DnaK suppressor protein
LLAVRHIGCIALHLKQQHPKNYFWWATEARVMNRPRLDKLRQQLEILQHRLRDDGTTLTERARSLNGDGSSSELSNAPLHLGDRGSEEYLQDMNAVLAENEGYLAGEVRDALARIDAGTFGQCEVCGKSITIARLEAIPFARHCVQCAEMIQNNGFASDNHGSPNFNSGRPHTFHDTLAHENYITQDQDSDSHAVGDAGGGTAFGGLAGSNTANGEPDVANLHQAMGSGNGDVAEERFLDTTAVEPVGYESDEDRRRYAEEERLLDNGL